MKISKLYLSSWVLLGACASGENGRLPASTVTSSSHALNAEAGVTSELDTLPLPEISESDERRGVLRLTYRKETHECGAGSRPQFFKPVPYQDFDPFLAQFLYRRYFKPGTVASLRERMRGRGLLRTQAAYAALAVCVDAKTGRLTDGQVFAIQADSSLSYSARLKRRKLDGLLRFYEKGRLYAEVGYDRGEVRGIEYFDPQNGRSQGEMALIPGPESRQFASGFRSAALDRSPSKWEEGALPPLQRISDGTCQ
jgi:hypothetical protein